MKNLPQLCCRCRNRDIGGKLKWPKHGQFFPSTKFNRQPVWICHPCLLRRGAKIPFKESYIEKRVREVFQALRIPFRPQYSFGRFRYDFALPKHNVLMEVDGRQWHRTKRQRVNDAVKAKYAEENGWTFVRVKNGPGLSRRIAKWLGQIRFYRAKKLAGDEETAKLAIEEGIL